MLYYVIFIVAVALIFDFCNGLNDAANSVATIVGTRVLPPRYAVLWAAFFNFAAAFFFETKVATTIGKGLVDQSVLSPHLVLAALLAAIIWTVFCTERGLPISVSHALMGSLAGAALVKGGSPRCWSKLGVIALFIVLSPLIGMAAGYLLMVATMWICRYRTPRSVDRTFRVLQLPLGGAYSLSHGLNDAQKTMGIIMALLISVPSLAHYAYRHGDAEAGELAWWIILSCHAMIALGTYFGGWKVISTLGHKVTKLQPVGGFCAETGGGATIIAVSALGIPVSTTHTITGSIFGVGITRRLSAVRWSVGAEIATAWVLTLPASAVLAGLIYYVMKLCGALMGSGPASAFGQLAGASLASCR